MVHKARSSIEKVPYCFSRSSTKFQGHMGQKIPDFFTRIERFQPVTPVWIHRWLEMAHNAWCSKEEMSYSFSKSSITFQGHMGTKIDDLNPILSKITRPVADIKSLRFALFIVNPRKSMFVLHRKKHIIRIDSDLIDILHSLVCAHKICCNCTCVNKCFVMLSR